MPRYISLKSLPKNLLPFVRPLPPRPITLGNPLRVQATPTDHLLSISPEQRPPNLRVQEWVDDRSKWFGVSRKERFGATREKEDRHLLRKGGLYWAVRER